MRSKKGAEKYWVIISLILGILVVAIVLYFIFHEYFTSEEMDWESCRQSIVLRNMAPEFSSLGGKIVDKVVLGDIKEKFPLKCKTQVVNIDFKNVSKAEKTFADTIAQCFFLLGDGQYNIYPSNLFEISSPCMVCARIHFNSDVVKWYSGDNFMSFTRALDSKIEGTDVRYWDYMKKDLKGEGPIRFLTNWTQDSFEVDSEQAGLKEPRRFDPEGGDVYIVLSSIVGTQGSPGYYVFYVQQKDFSKIYSDLKKHWFYPNIKVCSSIETVPA